MTAPVLAKVQAHVLRTANQDFGDASFTFARLPRQDPGTAGRQLVRRLLEAGLTRSDADAHRARGDVGCQVVIGLTHRGLERMGIPYRAHPRSVLDGDVDPFAAGMLGRREALGDPDTGDWPGADADLLLWTASGPDHAGRDEVAAIVADVGAETRGVEVGARAGEPVTILGFRDGTSQPFLSELASSRAGLPGGGTRTADGWQPVRIGEFVLGSTDAGGERLVPEPTWLTDGGTFLVYRKYRIHSTRFGEFFAEAGAVYERGRGRAAGEGGAATVAAKVVGRFRVGESPPGWPADHDALIAPPAGGAATPNDFHFDRDTSGHACPLGAHVRRANPRDALGFAGMLSERHRIVRRGVPWAVGDDIGLHFVAVNARIQDQFEFIQRQWLNTGAAFRLGRDLDPIVGSRPEGTPTSFVIQGDPPVVVTSPEPLTTLLGGVYVLVPGMAGLRKLAGVER
jgi:deferrochelatase/peroxidase EfeB